MSEGAGQAPGRGGRCVLRRNRSFGRDLVPCAGLQALLRQGRARIGVFEDLRLRQTSRLLVLTPEGGEPVLAEACPACGASLRR